MPDRKMFALVNDQGSACMETALCEQCHNNPDKRVEVVNRAFKDSNLRIGFQDCSGNDALVCQGCDYIPAIYAHDPTNDLLNDIFKG